MSFADLFLFLVEPFRTDCDRKSVPRATPYYSVPKPLARLHEEFVMTLIRSFRCD